MAELMSWNARVAFSLFDTHCSLASFTGFVEKTEVKVQKLSPVCIVAEVKQECNPTLQLLCASDWVYISLPASNPIDVCGQTTDQGSDAQHIYNVKHVKALNLFI